MLSPELQGSHMQLVLKQPVADLVVDVAVCEHCVEVVYTLLGIPVVIVLQTLFYRAHVHRVLDNIIVVLQGVKVQVE